MGGAQASRSTATCCRPSRASSTKVGSGQAHVGSHHDSPPLCDHRVVLADAGLGPAGGIAFGFVLIAVAIAWPRFAQSWMRTTPNRDGNRIIDRRWWHFTHVRLGQLMILLSGVVLVILDIITILR